MALTKPDVDGLAFDPHGPSQQVLYDSDGSGKGAPLAGFGVRVYPSGTKSYVFWYRTAAGRPRLITIGSTSAYTLAQARDVARGHARTVAEGGDPLADRKRARATTKRVDTFCDEWLEGYAKSHRRSWREDRRRIENRIKPALGSRSLADVTPADVAKLHHAIGSDAPVEANRVVQLLRAIYNIAESWGHLPDRHPNPAAVKRSGRGAVRTYPEKARRVFVREDEMGPFLEAVEAEGLAPLFLLILLTGSRKSEILRARWEHVDLERGELTLGGKVLGGWRGAAKEGGRTVYLSDAALDVLRGLGRPEGAEHLFPAPTDSTVPLDPRSRAVKGAWKRIRKASGLKHITLHDLRHTAGSWLLRLGYTELQIAEALGHESGGGTTRRYTHLEADQAREMLNDLADAIEASRQPTVVRSCPSCDLEGHADDAAYCRACGAELGGAA